MITTFSLFLVTLQATETQAAASDRDDWRTWTVEYPLLISPHVERYYNCLRSSDIRMGPDKTFEGQHRKSVTDCEKVLNKSAKKANEILASRGVAAKTTPADIAKLFDTIGRIHVARGMDLDDQMAIGLTSSPYRQTVTANGTVMAEGEAKPLDDAEWTGEHGQPEPAVATEPAK